MKRLIFILIFISFSSNVFPQWLVDGGNLIWPYGDVNISSGNLILKSGNLSINIDSSNVSNSLTPNFSLEKFTGTPNDGITDTITSWEPNLIVSPATADITTSSSLGTYAIHLKRNTSVNNGAVASVKFKLTIPANTTFRLMFDYKKSDTSASSTTNLTIYDETWDDNILSASLSVSSQYTTFDTTVTPFDTSSPALVWFHFESGSNVSSDTELWIDNIRLFIDSPAEYIIKPSATELTNLYGSPSSVGIGFTTYIVDSSDSNNFYLIISDGLSWWIFPGIKSQ